MFSQIFTQLIVYFRYWTISGSGLSLLFGLLWLLLYRPPLFKQPGLWLVMLGGALAGVLAVSIIQTPLSILLNKLWHEGAGLGRLLLVGLLSVVTLGLVQEGAKLVPLLVLRKRQGGQLDEQQGLSAGAVSGFGYGFLETFYVMNYLFISGWNWDVLANEYPALVLTSLERICMLGLNMGLSGLVGWGLAKGKGLRFYLLAAALHAFVAFINFLMANLSFPVVLAELALAVVMVALTVVTLSMRGEHLTKVDNS